ncbi:mechanosensitive ion channel family protein [Stackebrandtia soli]|uniref:mechanosensitive ion channel family protein n=1 Tax=Stackebrandtia soli TaxID=1892856 RepID=UPI0039E81075
MNITQSFQSALDAVVNFLPRALAFVVILAVGWIVAVLLRAAVSKLLAKVGLDRLAERGGMHRFTGKYTVSKMAGTLVYALILLFTLQIAFNAFGPNPVSALLNDLVAWLPQLFIAGVIMVVASAIANMAFELVSGAMSNLSYGKTIARIAQVAIIAVAAIAALNQIGIATTVTTPILIAGLAMIAGVVIVGVGGGLVQPMRQRWERALGVVESEAGNMRTSMAENTNRNRAESIGQPAYQSGQYSQESPATTQYPPATGQHPVTPGGGQYQAPSPQPGQGEQPGQGGQSGQTGQGGQSGSNPPGMGGQSS